MQSYRFFLQKEHDLVSFEQMNYLKTRQEEVAKQLETIMASYAETLSQEVKTSGFPSTEKAMDFLAHWQQKCKDKLLAIELENKRLTRASIEKAPNLVQTDGSQTNYIHVLLTKIQELKSERDGLELALRFSPLANPELEKQAFQRQSQELKELSLGLEEVHYLKDRLKQRLPVDRTLAVLNDSRYLTSHWQEFGDKEEHKEALMAYLDHLRHFFELQQNTLTERLSLLQQPQEFEGIKIQTASDLYLTYCKSLMDLQTRIVQLQNTLDQMDDPTFELSSLGIVFTDDVSRGLITKASELVLATQEESNRTSKEQERLKRELSTQQKFLKMHVAQTVELLKLQEDLWKKKIYYLQQAMLHLMQQQISLYQSQIEDHIAARLIHVNQEKELFALHQKEIQDEMAKLPKQWVAEKVIDQYVKMNERIVEEITKIVESKNISNNLEIIQSAPLDLSITPIHPKSPRLVMMALIGAAFGGLLTSFFVAAHAIATGLEASKESLEQIGLKVAGSIPKKLNLRLPTDQALGTARKALRLLKKKNPILVLSKRQPNMTPLLLDLIAKQGQKGIFLSLDFEKPSDLGLLQFLEGKVAEPPIQRGKDWDKLESGGITRFSPELVSTQKFQDLLSHLNREYDWIFADCPKDALSKDGDILFFNQKLVLLTHEKINEIEFHFNKDVVFIFIDA
jgi:hypothetical protein